jgi:8-oxo-dGTP pyrophosphatase MutT (NUDIX family)
MTTLQTRWGTQLVSLTWVESDALPAGFRITSAHGFCFSDEKVMLVNLDSRGWDFPGGHMEEGETPEECFAREAMEEACIEGRIAMLGYVLVDNTVDPDFVPGKYPAIGCQIYYRMDIENIHPFTGEFESSERALFAPADVPNWHPRWHEVNQAILYASEDRGPV